MLEFKSPEALSKFPHTDPAFQIVEDLVKRLITDYITEGWDYRPEDDGHTLPRKRRMETYVATETYPLISRMHFLIGSRSASIQHKHSASNFYTAGSPPRRRPVHRSRPSCDPGGKA